MNLSAIRSLVYTYLGTQSTDPAYPSATVTSLINAAANAYIADIQQLDPTYLRTTTTLSPTAAGARTYTLPANFAGVVEVRQTDADGARLAQVRDDELAINDYRACFAIYGADGSATLETRGVTAGVTLWLKYRYQPSELSATTDSPSWMPAQFHDLLAREAAIDAFGLGAEASPSPVFMQTTADRRGQFWQHVTVRGVTPRTTREPLS